MKRSSGILMHVSTLWGDYSIGGFGESAKQFVDFLADAGFTYWQVLPFGVTDDCNSPYKSYSAFAGNPYFIDLEILFEDGLITRGELDSLRQKTPYVCEFDFLRETRLPILKKASSRVGEDMRKKIEAFIEDNPKLRDFCVFMTLKERGDRSADSLDAEACDEALLFTWKFIQYEFFLQWKEIKEYANRRGIFIIGDIPIYVSSDSADVVSDREIFDLDAKGRLKNAAGVPPDYFSEDGQLWGNPLYDWKKMKENSYAWWKERVKHNLDIFDGVRIDHFRGFESFWSVPAGAESAKEGKWRKGGGKRFIDEIRKVSGNSLVIAEDLGEITPAVSELVRYSGFPGMRVFQFAFLGDTSSPHLPHNYVENCVAYTGTHDNNTLLGYLWELDEHTLRRVFDYCNYRGSDKDEACRYVIKTMLASHAGTVIFPIQDILGYGKDTRMNIPGSAKGNWQIRFTSEQINSIDRGEMRTLNELYGRI
ncbi:MAG: 4-alpha-glucanotransferase [Clostridia bacterium]|nr:4-alpha-glucanotransferase [Clostridia bacterium]